MERKKGIVIRRKIPDSLKDNPEIGISICKAMIEGLADFHSVDYSELGLQDLGKPEGFIERQIEGWYHRWSGAKLKESSKMDEIYNWLSKNIPHEDIHYSLVHNDYKLDNVMLNAADPSKLVAVFDWDMCTLGDSLSDLGALLAYWYEPTDPPYLKGMSMMPTEGMNFMTRSELVNYYEQCIGRKISNINFYHCLGLFRVVVIIAQIYYRFVKKQTQDQRFEAFGAIIPIVIKAAYDLIEKH